MEGANEGTPRQQDAEHGPRELPDYMTVLNLTLKKHFKIWEDGHQEGLPIHCLLLNP